MSRLQGKIALVTGSGSGIGAAICERLAEEGASLIVSGLNMDTLQQTADNARSKGATAYPLNLDVTDEDDWGAGMAFAERHFGGLDILVNNAGFGDYDSIESASLEGWRSVLACNLDGPFLGMRAAIPLMKVRGAGSIITIASAASFVGVPYSVAYSAAKAGLLGLTKAAALHCAQAGYNIRINAVHPGITATPPVTILDTPQTEEMFTSLSKATPLGRLADPREIANGVLFLASDESSFMTGSSMVIDGGFIAQ